MSRYLAETKIWIKLRSGPAPDPKDIKVALEKLLKSDTLNTIVKESNNFSLATLEVRDVESSVRDIT